MKYLTLLCLALEGFAFAASPPTVIPPVTALDCEVALGASTARLAIRQAPDEIKQKLRESWKSSLVEMSSWSLSALDVFLALDEDPTQARELVRTAIHKWLNRSPGQRRLPSSNILSRLDFQPMIEAPTTFSAKYQLEKYAGFRQRILSDILPPEYALQGAYTADYQFQFSALNGDTIFRLAYELDLHEEMQSIISVLLIHDQFEKVAGAAQLINDDGILYRTGLYMLANFYYGTPSPFYPNKLWDAIETLKRVRQPEMRLKVQRLFIDLAQDIMSPEFAQKLSILGTQEKVDVYLNRSLENVLRALSSAGENVLFLRPEDSIKVEYVTSSTSAELRSVIHRVLALIEKREIILIDGEIAAALQTTDDSKELRRRAEQREGGSPGSGIYYYAALGDIPAVLAGVEDLKEMGPSSYRYRLQQIFAILHRIGRAESLLSALTGDPLATEAFERMIRRIYPTSVRNSRGNEVDSRFYYFMENFRIGKAGSARDSFASAESLLQKGDSLNAGSRFLNAAFATYLRALPAPEKR